MKTPAQDQRRREQKVARRRKRIENGTRIRRGEGQGFEPEFAAAILERRHQRQERDRAIAPPESDAPPPSQQDGFLRRLFRRRR